MFREAIAQHQGLRKRRIAIEKQEKSVEYFVCGTTARTAVELAKVNIETIAYCFHGLRKLIYRHSMFSGEIEVDKSYSVKRPLGLEVTEKAKEVGSG